MDVSDAIVARRSVRNFARTPVPPDKLWKILDVGRRAPSGANRQPWLFIVVDDADIKGRIRRACESADREWWKVAPDWFLRWARSVGLSRRKSFLEQAPLLLCVFYDTTKPYSLESTWISIGYMALEATEL
jgi:nitroreductase